MDKKELQLLLASAIESMAATELQVGDLAASVVAIRLALLEASPDRFESLYGKYFEAAECKQVQQQSSAAAKALLEIARRLKLSD